MANKNCNAKRIRIRIVDAPPGTREHTSLAHARRYVKQGAAKWVDGAIHFIRRHAGGGNGPTLPDYRDAIDFRPHDSLFGQTFLPYPQTSQGSGRLKYHGIYMFGNASPATLRRAGY